MITLVKDIKDANCITHSGTMHADEIFATAFLELYKDNIKLFRTNNPTGNDKAIIYDIGKGKFDHCGQPPLRCDFRVNGAEQMVPAARAQV